MARRQCHVTVEALECRDGKERCQYRAWSRGVRDSKGEDMTRKNPRALWGTGGASPS